MNSIEEQARKYAERVIKPSKDNWMRKAIAAYRSGAVYNAEIVAFLEGAKAQKAIDIEKACKWLAERKCWDFYDDVEAKTFSEGDIKEFRKYMEDKLLSNNRRTN